MIPQYHQFDGRVNIVSYNSTSNEIGDQNEWSYSSRKGKRWKITEVLINHRNGDKYPLIWVKYSAVCYHKVLLM